MRITTTRPIAATAAVAAAIALLASGCGSGGGGGAGKPAASASSTSSTSTGGGNDETPIGQTGGDEQISPDQMAKAQPLQQTAPTKAAPETGDNGLSPDRDTGKPGLVAPAEPSSASSGAKAAPAAVRKKALPIRQSPRIGRIFGKASANRYWYCSASVVPSHGKNLLVTAGHCLWNDKTGKAQAGSWQFVPGYYAKGGRGYAPYGVYTASRWWAYNAWIKKHNWRYDFAFMKLRPGARGYRGAGRNVQSNVGAMGIAWNQHPNRTYVSIGYDAERRYGWDNGAYARYRKGKGRWISSWAQLNLMHRFSTGGASGGPWLIRWNNGKRIGIVDGVNSCSNRKSTATSAYFGSALGKLYKHVS